MTASMFDPRSIAVIGATDRDGTPGRSVLSNLLSLKHIRIFPVNPKRETVFDLPCYPHISSIPETVDLAVVVTPLETVPEIIEACGQAAIRGMVVMSDDFRESGPAVRELEEKISDSRKKYGMRILGAASLGFIRPRSGLNVTSLCCVPGIGEIALITQSGAFGKTLFDWGISSRIGFSLFVSLGSTLDMGFGDLIDFLGNDPYTRSIMIYMEDHIGDVKKFMSAARGFSRNKPIVFLKSPLMEEGTTETLSHSGALASPEDVYDAVFKRAGVVRVREARDLFNAAAVLYAKNLPKGPRLAIVTNAKGAGVMAMSRLIRSGGQPARYSADTQKALGKILPPRGAMKNFVDVFRDAGVARYMEALSLCLKDPGVDGVLVIYTPLDEDVTKPLAEAVSQAALHAVKPVITTWLGGDEIREGRDILAGKGIPSYDTPEEAVGTYLYMYEYERNLQLLYETPSELPIDEAPPKNHLKTLIKRSCKEAVPILTEEEAMKFLTNYGIPTVKSATANSLREAVNYADEIGYPVVLKIVSPDIIFRPDVGGIVTGIVSEAVLKEEYDDLLQHVRQFAPEASIRGVTVQKMIEVIDYELILGSRKDPTFGSVILFGMGGVGVQIFRDFSLGLPPLNQTLARRLIEDTKVYRTLQGYRGKPPADLRQIEQIIVSFSNLIVDFPEILEMDINPIVVSQGRACALGARIIPDRNCLSFTSPYPHLVITPYPTRYITHLHFADGTDVLLRPIRPEDEPLEHEMFTTLSEEALRGRYYQTIKDISHMMHVRSCNIDYDREMTIVAEIKDNGRRKLIGIGSFVIEPDINRCEFAVIVHDGYQGQGLAYRLMDILIGIAGEKGLREFYGYVEPRNLKMLRLCEKLGMVKETTPDDLFKLRLFLH